MIESVSYAKAPKHPKTPEELRKDEEALQREAVHARNTIEYTYAFVPLEHPAQKYAEALFAELLSPESAQQYHIRIAHDWNSHNAVAIADGTIVISAELFRFADYKEEIQGILAHELTHLDREHSRKFVQQLENFQAKSRRDMLDRGLALLSIKRAQEYEADLRGVMKHMDEHGVNPYGMLSIYKKMEEAERRWRFGYSAHDLEHGDSGDRVLNIEASFHFKDLKHLSKNMTPLPAELKDSLPPCNDHVSLHFGFPKETTQEERDAIRKNFGERIAELPDHLLQYAAQEFFVKDRKVISDRSSPVWLTMEKDALFEHRVDRRFSESGSSDDERRAGKVLFMELVAGVPYIESAGQSREQKPLSIGSFGSRKALPNDPVLEARRKDISELFDSLTSLNVLYETLCNSAAFLRTDEQLTGSYASLLAKVAETTVRLTSLPSGPAELDQLLNAMEPWFEALQRLFEAQGRSFSKDHALLSVGKGIEEYLRKTASEAVSAHPLYPLLIKRKLLQKLEPVQRGSQRVFVQEVSGYEDDEDTDSENKDADPIPGIPKDVDSQIALYLNGSSIDIIKHLTSLFRRCKTSDSLLDHALTLHRPIEKYILNLIEYSTYEGDRLSQAQETVLYHINQRYQEFVAHLEDTLTTRLTRIYRNSPHENELIEEDTILRLRLYESIIGPKGTEAIEIIDHAGEIEASIVLLEVTSDYDGETERDEDMENDEQHVGIRYVNVSDLLQKTTTIEQFQYVFKKIIASPETYLDSPYAKLMAYAAVNIFCSCKTVRDYLQERKKLEDAGIPIDEILNEYGSIVLSGLYQLWSTVDLVTDDEELAALRDLARHIEDPFLRDRLRAHLRDISLEGASYEKRIDLLVGTPDTAPDLPALHDLIEAETETRQQFDKARKAAMGKLDDFIQEGSREGGFATLALNVRMGGEEAVNMLLAMLTTSESDLQLKAELYDHSFAPDHSQQRLMAADTAERLLFSMDRIAKLILLRKMLTGDKGILENHKTRHDFLTKMTDRLMERTSASQDRITGIVDEVVGVLGKSREWHLLYFALQTILADRIMVPPQRLTPWNELLVGRGMETKVLLGKSEFRTAQQKNLAPLFSYAFARQGEENLRGSLERLGVLKPTERQERMTATELIIEVAQRAGALGVRFLQLLPQFVNLTDEERDAFTRVYDDVYGQSKITALDVLEREWPAFWDSFERFGKRIGGGSLMSAYECTTTTGDRRVVKILNPNAEYHLQSAYAYIREIIDLLKTQSSGYETAYFVLDEVNTWIKKDINFENFLEKDAAFRERNNGFRVPGNRYRIKVPQTYGPGSKYFMHEEYIEGYNLTQWDDILREGHDGKQIISLITHSTISQLMSGVLHSDIHPGNYRVTPQGEVAILDRNFFIELTKEQQEFVQSLLNPLSTPEYLLETFFAVCEVRIDEETKMALTLSLLATVEEIKQGNWNVMIDFLVELRKQNIHLPIQVTLLFKNISSLQGLAHKAGFANIVEAYLYQPSV